MSSALSVGGLLVGNLEELVHDGDVEVEEKRPVKKDKPGAAPLGIPGEFHSRKDEIGVSCHGNRLVGKHRGDGIADSSHDILVRRGDRVEVGAPVGAKDQSVVQAARTLDYGAASSAAPDDRNAMRATIRYLDVGLDRPRKAEDDKWDIGLPQAECLALLIFFSDVEQSLVTGDIACRSGERTVKVCQ